MKEEKKVESSEKESDTMSMKKEWFEKFIVAVSKDPTKANMRGDCTCVRDEGVGGGCSCYNDGSFCDSCEVDGSYHGCGCKKYAGYIH
jgi:hypothetical protein